MLYDLWLLDVPKLLDLAALYGTGSPKLVHRLMQQVMGGRQRTCSVPFVDLAALYALKLVHCLLQHVCRRLFICATSQTFGSIRLCRHDKSLLFLTD